MNDFTMSVADARGLAIATPPDVPAIRLALDERAAGVLHILDTCVVEKRERTASEERDYARLSKEVDELEQLHRLAISKRDAATRVLDEARNALPNFAPTGGPFNGAGSPIAGAGPVRGSTSHLGDALRNAVDEVRSGRTATSYVDFPTEQRAISTGDSGGYGVPTVLASPVEALAAASVVMSLPGVVTASATSGDRMRFPRFNAVQVGGVGEAAALTAAATDIDAVDVVFQKFGTVELLSTELEEDFSAPALEVLGRRMLKDLAARVDLGLLQGTGNSDTVGLFSQAGVSTTSVAALPTDFDRISEAVYQLELNDGNPVAWIMHPRSWRIWKQVKTGLASDKSTLLESSPQLAPRSLAGLPVFTSSAISLTSGAGAGSTAALLDTSQIVVVTRRPARLEVSREFRFDTDQVAIRATTRIGLGVIDAAGGVSLLTDIRAS